MCILAICVLFCKCLFQSSAHFPLGCLAFYWVLSCMSCLYILEMNPLVVILFANIFSHPVGCLPAFFVVSFAVQILLCIIRSHLFIFVLFSLL